MNDPDAMRRRLLATPWFTAERTSEGARILLRGRRLERECYGCELYPTVVTIEHRYERQRTDGLPTQDQHSRYQEIVLQFVDAIEAARIGIHVFGDTTQGLVREWFYVSELPTMDRLSEEHLRGRMDYELCYDDDPTWSFVDRAISPIRGDGWGDASDA